MREPRRAGLVSHVINVSPIRFWRGLATTKPPLTVTEIHPTQPLPPLTSNAGAQEPSPLPISQMDPHTYPGRGLSLSQLVFALNEELKRVTYSPVYVAEKGIFDSLKGGIC